jgi:thiosulfate dehydrogenase
VNVIMIARAVRRWRVGAGLAAACLAIAATVWPGAAQQTTPPNPPIWTVPEIGALPDDANGRLVRKGRDLVTATYAYIGPLVADPEKRYAGNSLACSDCHLNAGTKMFGLPIFGLFDVYPHYSARSGAGITIEDRVNQCMTRSMNGRPLSENAPEMTAIVAYLKFLSSGVAPGQTLPGLGSGHMPELGRAADPERGLQIYERGCGNCHGAEGAGFRQLYPAGNPGYLIPPLWGADSFNDGAGMNRLITAANFDHFNMPRGSDYLAPRLSVEEAWDVAAYVISQPRPHKSGLDKDFPDLLEKPVDTPYGPYADGFSEQQHKYGPFAPIRAELARLKAGMTGKQPPPQPAAPAGPR